MTVGRKLKRNVFIDTDIDCQNCGCWQRVCTWNGECDNLEPMTNEEWLRSCTTEQLAEELLAWWFDGANTYSQFGLFKWEIDEAKEKIMEWLKQPHGGES